MSYDIYIGNATIEYEKEEYEGETTVFMRLGVAHVTQPNAPTFPNDAMTGNGNSRHPGYSQWGDFVQKVGLGDLFFSKSDGLMSEHPGIAPLMESHYVAIKQALDAYRATLADDVKPGFLDFEITDASGRYIRYMNAREQEEHYQRKLLDASLARLIWLEWWVRWALDNCQYPAIANH